MWLFGDLDVNVWTVSCETKFIYAKFAMNVWTVSCETKFIYAKFAINFCQKFISN